MSCWVLLRLCSESTASPVHLCSDSEFLLPVRLTETCPFCCLQVEAGRSLLKATAAKPVSQVKQRADAGHGRQHLAVPQRRRRRPLLGFKRLSSSLPHLHFTQTLGGEAARLLGIWWRCKCGAPVFSLTPEEGYKKNAGCQTKTKCFPLRA